MHSILITKEGRRTVLRHALFAFSSGILFSIAALVICKFSHPWYGYAALLQSASLGDLAYQDKAKSSFYLGSMNPFKNQDSITSEAIAYLEFKYIDAKRLPGDYSPFLRQVKQVGNTDRIEVVVFGSTLSEARNFIDVILKDLQGQYEAKIKDIVTSATEQMSLLDVKIKIAETELNKINSASSRLGFTPVLAETAAQLEKDLFTIEMNRQTLKASLTPQKIYNFRYIEMRPVHPLKPVSPKKSIIVPSAFLLGILLSLYLTGIRESLGAKQES